VTTNKAVAAALAKIWSEHIPKTVANAVPRPRSGTIPIHSVCFFLFSGSVSMSQKMVVPVKAAEAVEMSRETYAEVVFSLAVSTATSCKTRPGTASHTSSPHFVYTISARGSKAAPVAGSAPLATLYASTPAITRLV
jgi:hypothetical protein